jgi:hypothetical protein
MIRWKTLVVPLIVGGLAFHFVGLGFWDTSKQAILVSLSVIAAGALVRLARGFPFTSPDHYEVDEIRNLAVAIEKIIRALRALILFVLAVMVMLVIAKPGRDFIVSIVPEAGQSLWVEQGLSAILGFMLAYVFMRMVQVVQGDYDLTILQSGFLVRAVERRQAKAFEELERKGGPSKFKNPEGYGKIIDPQ